ncbi:MAG: sporulation peptidase YabG, partial [Bacillota bacterium]
MEFKKGDFVTRSSYNSDIIFKIIEIKEDKAILKSYKYRLMADAPIDDLIKYKDISRKKLKKNLLIESFEHLKRHQRNLVLNNDSLKRSNGLNSFREIPGKVLHLDGDKDYLDISMQNYDTLQIEARGFFIPEREQPESISRYLEKYK